ncbi:MAG: DUF2569 domain-containing protein [Firmicutes bacterium]|nr:DUF2569 domain-containing protein [Bacillota bacterium]
MKNPETDYSLIGEYNKIGGWLVLVGITMVISPFFHFNVINENLKLYSPDKWNKLINNHPLWSILISFETITSIILLVVSVVLLIAFLKKKVYFPSLMIIYRVLNLVIVITISLIAVQIPYIANGNIQEYISAIIGQSLACAIWIPYFIKSKRVKRTFIN